MSQATATRLASGDRAPHFQTEDAFGNPIDLRAYAGQPVLLSFFRNGACALCNLQIHKLIERYPEYHRRGLAVLAVFESPTASIRQYVGRQDAPFPIIADPQGELYACYDVEISPEKVQASMDRTEVHDHVCEAAELGWALTREEGSNFNRLTADFLIDANGLIQAAHYAAYVGDHLSFESIERFLALQL